MFLIHMEVSDSFSIFSMKTPENPLERQASRTAPTPIMDVKTVFPTCRWSSLPEGNWIGGSLERREEMGENRHCYVWLLERKGGHIVEKWNRWCNSSYKLKNHPDSSLAVWKEGRRWEKINKQTLLQLLERRGGKDKKKMNRCYPSSCELSEQPPTLATARISVYTFLSVVATEYTQGPTKLPS